MLRAPRDVVVGGGGAKFILWFIIVHILNYMYMGGVGGAKSFKCLVPLWVLIRP